MKIVLGVYLFVGVLIAILVDLSWDHLDHKENDIELTYLLRAGIIILWPILLLGVFVELVKESRDGNDGPNPGFGT